MTDEERTNLCDACYTVQKVIDIFMITDSPVIEDFLKEFKNLKSQVPMWSSIFMGVILKRSGFTWKKCETVKSKDTWQTIIIIAFFANVVLDLSNQFLESNWINLTDESNLEFCMKNWQMKYQYTSIIQVL